MTQKQTVFIATVFPDNQDKASLIGLKQRLEAEIKSATGQAPALVRAALGASVYLICGEFTRISQALQTAATTMRDGCLCAQKHRIQTAV